MTNAKAIPSLVRDIMKISSEHIKGNTLDLGAGKAKYKKMILENAEKYTAYDMVAAPNVDIVGDVHNLVAFETNTFDTVICTEVLEHVKEPWRVLEEIARVLKPGGRCILTTPFLLPFHADPHDYYRYTVEGGMHLFTRTGLKIVESAKTGNKRMVIAEAFKFVFCNPYIHTKPSFLRRNIFRVIYKFLSLGSHNSPQDSIFYTGIYIVAEKPRG